MPYAKLRQEVAASYAELIRSGLCVGSAGNVSVAVPGGMLITRSGATQNLTKTDVVECDLDGRSPGPFAPSSEWEMHAEIYRANPKARAVVHAHSDACVAVGSLGQPIPAFHYMILGFGGDEVPCAPYETFGSHALADAAVTALRDRTACLLANHGMICHGHDLTSAMATAQRLETLARQYWMVLAAGKPRLLDAAQIAAARERYKTYGDRTPAKSNA